MANLQSFDPSFYLFGTNDMCNTLKNKDNLDTQLLVKDLYKTLVDESGKLHQGIFSILTETGGGKTFFLALLYCLLKEKSFEVHYVDILHFVIHGQEEKMMEDIQALCMEDAVTVILIDNLEKHSPHFALDFIYRLNVLVRQENILCVLSYDESVLFKKIDSVYGGNDNSMQIYFQNFIDIEYFLSNKNADLRATMKIFYEIHPLTVETFRNVFEELNLTIREKNIIAKKVRFYIQNYDERENTIEYLPYVFYLTILKLRDKKAYRVLLRKFPKIEEELELYKEVLKPIMEARKTISTAEEGYEFVRVANNETVLMIVQKILNKMELVHV